MFLLFGSYWIRTCSFWDRRAHCCTRLSLERNHVVCLTYPIQLSRNRRPRKGGIECQTLTSVSSEISSVDRRDCVWLGTPFWGLIRLERSCCAGTLDNPVTTDAIPRKCYCWCRLAPAHRSSTARSARKARATCWNVET